MGDSEDDDIENQYNPRVMSSYLRQQQQIAIELMLMLNDENDRKITSKWLKFLFDPDTFEELLQEKLLIVQGLILMLNANILVPPLNEPPTENTDITELSQQNFMHLINYELNKIRLRSTIKPPKVEYEVSEDKREYVAYQKLVGHGSHFCYVYSGSKKPLVKTEDESGVPILDESITLEKEVHPLLQKYIKEVKSCMPPKKDPIKFKYHDMTESFGGMNIPDVDPDDDVVLEYEVLNEEGEIGGANSQVMSDLDESGDKYDQFKADPLHHDQPRIGFKETMMEKEQEARALLEDELKNKSLDTIDVPAPKIKQTVTAKVRSVRVQPVSLGGNRLGLVARVPKSPVSTPRTRPDNFPHARRDLINALRNLEHEMQTSPETTITSDMSSSFIAPNIQSAIDKVWQNPLLHDLKDDEEYDTNQTLPPPPKINFTNDSFDQNQTI